MAATYVPLSLLIGMVSPLKGGNLELIDSAALPPRLNDRGILSQRSRSNKQSATIVRPTRVAHYNWFDDSVVSAKTKDTKSLRTILSFGANEPESRTEPLITIFIHATT